MKNKKRKRLGFISIEVIILLGVILTGGLSGVIAFTQNAQDEYVELQEKEDKVFESAWNGQTSVPSNPDGGSSGGNRPGGGSGGSSNPEQNSVIVTFDGRGGSGSQKTINVGNAVGDLPTSSRPGYQFLGWYTEINGGNKVTETYLPLLDTTFYAQWKANDYVVRYNGNTNTGGSTRDSEHVFGAVSKLTKNGFTKIGHSFNGWNTMANGSGKSFTDEQSVTNLSSTEGGIFNLYAQWKVNSYTASFDGNGGTNGTPITKNYGEALGVLPNSTRTGYTFAGWFTAASGGSQISDTTTMPGDNVTYFAQWTANDYVIDYELNGGKVDGTNPDTYNPETETFTLINPTKEGFTFQGWTGSNGSNPSKTITITKGSSGNKSFVANWSANTYTIQYNGNGATGGSTANSEHTYGVNSTLTANGYTKYGYVFNGWNTSADGSGKAYPDKANVNNLTNEANGTVVLYAQWKEDKYSITYNLNGGELEIANPSGYTVETPTFKLNNPTKQGYLFTGWTGSNGSVAQINVSVNQGTTGNLTYTANWAANTYVVKYDGNGSTSGNMSDSTHTYGVVKKLDVNKYTKTGYEFLGWNTAADGSGTSYANEANVKDLTNTLNGSVTLYAQWGILDYTYEITYMTVSGIILGNSEVTNEFGATKDITPREFTGYTTPASQTITWDVAGNKPIVFIYSPITYTIKYELDGGIGSTNNPMSYNIETETFKLVNPYKTGYRFDGWTGSNGNVPSDEVEVKTGSTGNKTFVANWLAMNDIQYVVEHYKMNVDGTTYSLYETEKLIGTTGASISPEVKNYTGFTTPTVQSTTVNGDGSTVVKYYYTRNKYNVNYTIGTGISAVSGSGNYYYEANVTLTATVKDGYTFKQWTSNNTSLAANSTNNPYTFKVKAGNVTLTPSATENTYTITYNLNGGNVATSNPISYKVTTEAFTLNNPTKKGYTFKGWTGSNGSTPSTSVTVSKGTTGNLTYNANWEANTNTITYYLYGGTNPSNAPTTFKTDEKLTLPTPTKEGYTFIGWYEDSEYELEFASVQTSLKESIEVHAKWEARDDIQYVVEHYKMDTNGTTYTICETEEYVGTTDSNVTPKVNTYTGFTSPSAQSVTVSGDGSTVVKYYYTRNKYTLTVNPNGGTWKGNTNTQTFTQYYETSMTIDTPTKVGHEFVEWSLTGEGMLVNPMSRVAVHGGNYIGRYVFNDSLTVPNNILVFNGAFESNGVLYTTMEIRYVTANESQYIDLYYINDEIEQQVYSKETGWIGAKYKTVDFINEGVHGYSGLFGKWLDENATKGSSDESNENESQNGLIYTFGAGNGTLTAQWSILEYTYDVVYVSSTGATLGTTTVTKEHGTTNTVEPKEFTGYNKPASQTVKWDAESKTITFTYTTINYSITYTLNGGIGGTGNPVSYNIETTTFTLINPYKTGYTFRGWTGANGSTPSTNVSITKGSTGNKTFTANWLAQTDIPYTVEHYKMNMDGSGYELYSTDSSVGTADASITPEVRTYEGFTSPAKQTATIKADGSTVVKYYYERNKYTLTINPDGGAWNDSSNVQSFAQYYESTMEINEPSKEGYEFVGWSLTGEGTFVLQSPEMVYLDAIITGCNFPYTFKYVEGWTWDDLINSDSNIVYYTVSGYDPDDTTIYQRNDAFSIDADGNVIATFTSGSVPSGYFYEVHKDMLISSDYTIDTNRYIVDNELGSIKPDTNTKYELSGTWVFNDNIVINSEIEQMINFTTNSEGMNYGGIKAYSEVWNSGGPLTGTELDYMDYYEVDFGGWEIKYEGSLTDNYDYTWLNKEDATIYFGSTPQTVSKEFYEWFTANAVQTSTGESSGDTSGSSWLYTFGAGNGTLTAQWNVNSYTATFDATGGSISSSSTITKNYGEALGTLPVAEKDGYTFKGWYTAETGGTKISSSTTMPANNVTYYAQWSTNSYTYNIIYQSTSGIQLGTATVKGNYGTSTTVSPKAFTGYTSPSSQTVTFDSASTKTITFKYTPVTYTISYTLNGGTVATANKTSYTIETATFNLKNPTKNGETFVGWTGSNGSTPSTIVTISKGSTGNKTYTANWEANTYTVQYNANGGAGTMSNSTHKYGVASTLNANKFTYEGYEFIGWNTMADGSGISYTDSVSVINLATSGTITLYAQWESTIEYTLSGTWKFNNTISLPSTNINQNINYGIYLSNGTLSSKTNINASNKGFIEFDSYRVMPMEIARSSYSELHFGEEPQAVSKEFYEWFTANAMPTLSGEWVLNESLIVPDNTNIEQEINFISDANYCVGMRIKRDGSDIAIYYDDINRPAAYDDGSGGIMFRVDEYRYIDFGSESQPVSKEFYEWFTANAIKLVDDGCFIAGTQVLMEDGTTKNIEDIKIGDRVVSYDPTTQEFYISNVIKTTEEISYKYYEIELEDGTILNATGNHPMYTEDGFKSVFGYSPDIECGELLVDDRILKIDGYKKVVAITEKKGKRKVYNLGVATDDELMNGDEETEDDTFVVEGAVSHNHSGGAA